MFPSSTFLYLRIYPLVRGVGSHACGHGQGLSLAPASFGRLRAQNSLPKPTTNNDMIIIKNNDMIIIKEIYLR